MHQPFNTRFHDVQPQAIVLCATPEDVSETISFLAGHGLESATRGGGHCFAGHSSASLKVTATGGVDQPPSVDVYAAPLGTEFSATELLDELVVRAGSDPISASHTHMSFPETRSFWAQLGVAEDGAGEGPQPDVQPSHLVAKSEFFRRPLPTDAIAALVETFSHGRVPGESRELDFMP